MKKIQLALILLLIISCNSNDEVKPIERVTKFYNGFNNSNYNEIKALLADSITIKEGSNYIVPHSIKSFYEHFKWDSVFKTRYKLVKLESVDSAVIVTIESRSLRYEFLKNNPLKFKNKIGFDSGKISTLETIDYMDVDWTTWERERDTLVRWTKINHPEIDSFIHDLSMKGGQNYLKAIALYTANKK